MNKKIYWALVLGLMVNVIVAQNCNRKFKGIVKDFHDGTPILGAAIQVETSKQYAITDGKGNFTLKNLCAEKLWIVVSHVSCKTIRIQIDPKKDVFKEIRLEHHIEELNEVKLRGEIDKKTKTSQETILKDNVLQRYSTLSLGDAIKEIPGVSSINTGNTIVKPVINGLHSSRVLIMTNNVRLQDQEWGIEHAPNIDIGAAGSVSVIKGAGALEYGGDAIGGVVVVNPNRIYTKDTLYGRTIISGRDNGRGYGLNTNLTKSWDSPWYFTTQISHKRAGDFRAPDYNLTNTGIRSTSFSTSAGYRKFEYGFDVYFSHFKNEIGILSASHVGNVEDLVDAINSQQPSTIESFSYDINAPKQEVSHQIFKSNYYQRFESLGRLDIQYDFQSNSRKEFDIRRGNRSGIPAVDLELITHTLKSTFKLDSNSKAVYKLGLSAGYQNNFPNPDTGVRRLIPDYDKYDLGVFVLGDFKLNDDLVLDVGVRYDFNRIDAQKFYQISRWQERGYDQDFSELIVRQEGIQYLTNPIFNFHNISASSGLLIKRENSSYIFNYALSSRAPNPAELFSDGLHHSAARIELGDIRIDQEISNRISGSYNYQKNNFGLNIQAFFNHINGFIYIEPIGVETTTRGAFPVWEYKQINASLFGIDTDINYNFHEQWSIQNKSSFIKGNDLTTNRPLIDIPSFRSVSILRYSNPKWSGFNLELQSEVVLRQNEFPNNNFNAFILRTGQFILVDVSTPPPAYHLLSLRGDVNFNISKKNDLTVSLTVNNLLDTSYREYLNRLRYFADELGRNFSIQFKFNY